MSEELENRVMGNAKPRLVKGEPDIEKLSADDPDYIRIWRNHTCSPCIPLGI